ncbi:MAG: CehA/McbA family metallohydrolase [Sarcina sp.]
MSKKKYKISNNEIDLNKLNFFYGVPHSHTSFSTGKGTPGECIEIAYRNDLDFLIITDHNNYLEKSPKLNKWQTINKLVSKYNKKNSDFIVIAGFEVSSSEFGHFNIINPPNYFTGNVDNITALMLWCLKDTNTLVFINHPHSNVTNIPLTKISNSLICSIEIGNGTFGKKYTKHDKIYFNMLDKGWKLSAINGQDNHNLNIGKEENLTCIISHSLSKNDLIYGLKNRHTFSTESKSLKMYFTINNIFMGGIVNLTSSKLKFLIYIEDSIKKIDKIQIITSNNKIIKENLDLDLHKIKFMYEHKHNIAEKWFVVKVILYDKREAISSPIFITNENL